MSYPRKRHSDPQLSWLSFTATEAHGYVHSRAVLSAEVVNAVLEADCSTEDCSLALYMGFSGDDKNSVAFQTGHQISQVNQYAVSTLYNNIVQQVGVSTFEARCQASASIAPIICTVMPAYMYNIDSSLITPCVD